MDDRLFRNTMGKFATGVTVITTAVDGEPYGMTANAFMSVSLSPKLIVVSIGENAQMNARIAETGEFGVSFLAENQKDLSMIFAGQIKENLNVQFKWQNNLPVIENALANLTCKVFNTHVEGDHTLYVGEVTSLDVVEGNNPLIFFEGKYQEIH
ncbi:flavin reductase family protein [Rummeliibacillus pycnus]|uniref:flavin reductase family protein n=1 Tax=Rummeliibacillus pycnus TaxID=101070 RepID=UPI000C99F257|nr:flavin reductase family protein [Rummeliibacillus pycnus]